MTKYRVLTGVHTEGFYPAGHPQAGLAIKYGPREAEGAIVDSKSNLLRHNVPGYQPKFAPVDESSPVAVAAKQGFEQGNTAPLPPPNDGLEGLSLAELKREAEAEELDLGNAKTKEQVIALIRASRA